jgi:hypothetical protein
MSYSAIIHFKTIKADEVYGFFQKLKAEATLHLGEIAKENFIYSPYSKEKETDKRKLLDDAKNWARTSIFNYRYFYLPKHNLLAVFGVPDCLENLFDLTGHFQNSCDQDYDFEDWKGVPIFEQIAEKWKNATDEEVYKHFEYPNEYEEPIDYDYYRRTFAYDEIWAMCENYLYNDEEVVYISLFGYWDITTLRNFSLMCKEEYENWCKQIEQQDHPTEKGGVENA